VRPVVQSVDDSQPCPSVHVGQPPPPQAWSQSLLVAVSQHIPSVPHSLLQQSLPKEQLVPFEQSQLPLPQQVWFMGSHVRPVAQSVVEEQLVPSEQSPLPLPQQVPLL
jgi:hypothetical protein